MAKKTEQPNAHGTFFKHPEIVADFLKHNLPFKVAQQLDFSILRERVREFLHNKSWKGAISIADSFSRHVTELLEDVAPMMEKLRPCCKNVAVE